MTGKVVNQFYIVQVDSSVTKSFAPQQSLLFTLDYADKVPDGYKMMDINSISLTGAYVNYLLLQEFLLSTSGKTVSLRYRCVTTSDTITATFRVWVNCYSSAFYK